jgi:AhpD family alkylhydroperoxidase
MVGEYVAKLSAAGFSDVRTRLGDDGGDRGFTSAYVEAERPLAGVPASSESSAGTVSSAGTEESGVAGLSASDKELVALGASIGAGCHPCTQYHTQAALKAGLDAVEVRWAIEMAQVVRARGGVAVANVGRRILGVDQQELAAQGAPPCRDSALVWLGAAAGCNSGVLLAEYAPQAAALGVGAAELREAIDVAEMVKTQAGKFLSRDVERVLGKAPEPATAAGAPSVSCCAPGGAAEVAETVAGAATGDIGPGCGCGGEGQ